MLKILLVTLLTVSFANSQVIEFTGKVKGNNDLDQIHVINKTTKAYGITNTSGDFKILAKRNDTILLSSILYQKKVIVISSKDVKNKHINIEMLPFVNQLGEVVIGKVLTGNILSDIKNMGNKKHITFADVGIPGYTGRLLTQSERRLHTAGDFKPIMLLGLLAGSMPLDPVINAITGRTKRLKKRINLENRENLLIKVKLKFGNTFFEQYTLPKDKQAEFYLFCSEHEFFIENCSGGDFLTLQFLTNQYKIFLKRIKP